MIGITIITGFLGSGKTTLLKNLLQESFKRKKKIAIIHNEFTDDNNNIDTIIFKDINDIYKFPKEYENNYENNKEQLKGIEKETETREKKEKKEKKEIEENEQAEEEIELKIVKEIENENGYIYELNNGCLCCSNKSNFVALIEQILSFKSSYDFIFVEVAGVYDNIKVNNLLWLDELNNSTIYLDSIIHVIDSYNFMNMYDHHYDEMKYKNNDKHKNKQDKEKIKAKVETELIYKQILVCDVLIINKIDKIKEADIERLQNFMKNLNPLASIFLTCYAKVGIEKITNLKCYEKKNIKNLLSNFNNEKTCFRYNQFTNCSVKFNLDITDLIKLSEKLSNMKEKFLQDKNKDILKSIFNLKKVGIFSYKKINETLASLLWNSELKIYRGKGIFLAFNDDIYNNKNKLKINIYYYQSVGDVYEINVALTDIHVFFKEYLKKENINTNISHVCEKNDCFQGCQLTKSEICNETNFINSSEHKEKDECDSSQMCNHFIENEYFSDSSLSDDEIYNLNNILNSRDVFVSKFLFIGKEINENQIWEKLNSCFCERVY